MTIYRSDIPEERDQARAEAIAAYRERLGLRRCGGCGKIHPYDKLARQFLEDCEETKGAK